MEDRTVSEELQRILELQKEYFSCEKLREDFSLDYMIEDEDELLNFHEYLGECERYVNEGKSFAIPFIEDLSESFTRLKKSANLIPEEIYSIGKLLETSSDIYKKLADRDDLKRLQDNALDLTVLDRLKDQIFASVSDNYDILDSASPALKTIRKEMTQTHDRLTGAIGAARKRYSKFLTDDVIALKGGNETLPVKASMRGEVKGIVVSQSSSGETIFVIPYEIVDIQNMLAELKNQEDEEITRILNALSKQIRSSLKEIERNYQIVLLFDRLEGAVRYGHSIDGCIASLSDDSLRLSSLFHPLIDKKKCVSNSLFLGKDAGNTLVISGPNAGGKSVLIKSVAVVVYMDRLGLFVPCKDKAEIPFFDNVYFLSGDNQSVLENLSTFSSHLVYLKDIIDNATSKSLVIIDEIGEGTSPYEGEALAVSIIKHFEELGCFSIFTSHFEGVKNYAMSSDAIVSGAMEFDSRNLTPTYRFMAGKSGKSYGIELAKSIGLDESVINEAENYLSTKEGYDYNKMLDRLNKREEEIARKEEGIAKMQEELEKLTKKRERAIESLENEKTAIRKQADERISKIVDERLEQIDQIWKDNGQDMNFSQVSKARGELKKAALPTEEKPAKKKNVPTAGGPVEVGSYVVDEENNTAKVIEIKKNEALLDYDGIKIRRKLDGLKRSKAPAKKDYEYVETVKLDVGESQGFELNIIGLHVDEAMREVVSFLDNAVLHKYKSVRIIHGAGSFALKNAVWKYLENHPKYIKDYRLGQEGEGGLGATIVHLK